MSLKSLYDITCLADKYHQYLIKKGVLFNVQGFPVFKKEMFLDEWPKQVVPFDRRNSKLIGSKKDTVLCHYAKDKRIYPRLENVWDEIDEYSLYKGVVFSDVTVTSDMDYEWQKLIILLNHMYAMILAINGIKIVANLRIGNSSSINSLAAIPKEVMCASGFLGCEAQETVYDMSYISKLLYVRPSKLLIYGKHDAIAEAQMDNLGINYKQYPDYHRLCKGVY